MLPQNSRSRPDFTACDCSALVILSRRKIHASSRVLQQQQTNNKLVYGFYLMTARVTDPTPKVTKKSISRSGLWPHRIVARLQGRFSHCGLFCDRCFEKQHASSRARKMSTDKHKISLCSLHHHKLRINQSSGCSKLFAVAVHLLTVCKRQLRDQEQ